MDLRKKQLIDYYLGDFLTILLKPFFILAGKLLRRDHCLSPRGDIVVLKLLGGGSLIIAMPALLSIRNKFPDKKINLITTPALLPFSEIIGIFDNIYLIDETSGISKAFYTAFKALQSVFLSDTLINLEVHSRLSTIFSALTCSRNRFGYYCREVFWRKNIETQLVFFNISSG